MYSTLLLQSELGGDRRKHLGVWYLLRLNIAPSIPPRSTSVILLLASHPMSYSCMSVCFVNFQSGQYASVYVDNASRMTVKIQGDSDFTGILFGV